MSLPGFYLNYYRHVSNEKTTYNHLKGKDNAIFVSNRLVSCLSFANNPRWQGKGFSNIISPISKGCMKSKWITHLNHRILYIDLSGFRENIHAFNTELSETVTTIGQEMYQQPLASVLVLVDLRNTVLTQDANKLLTERIKDTKKYVKRTAVVGLTGIRKMFLDFFTRLAESETGSFDEPESAKAWLIK